MVTTYDWGDGRTYSDLPNALAAPALTLADDYDFPGYLNTGSSRTYSHSADISIPTFVTTSGQYYVKIRGAVGSINDLTSQIQLSFTSASANGLYAASFAQYGLIIENLELASAGGINALDSNNAYGPTVNGCYIHGAIHSFNTRYRPQIINCVITATTGAALYTSAGNGALIIDSLLRGTIGIETVSKQFFIVKGCSIYGSNYGISTMVYFHQYMNCAISGGTYAIQNVVGNAQSRTSSLIDCIFWSESNTTKVNPDGTIAQMMKEDSSTVRCSLADPKWAKTGDDKAWFVPDATSIILTGNQTAQSNDIWTTQDRDLFSYGAWSDYNAADYPAITDVRKNISYDNGAKTGSAYIPGAGDVRFGINVDATTGSAYIPGASDVRFGTNVDATTGTAYIPSENDVRLNVDVDATVGNVTLPIVSDVKLGVTYDTNLSKTGTYAGGGSAPAQPTVTLVDQADGTGATATVSGSGAATTNTLYYKLFSEANWTTGNNRTGDGTIDMAVAVTGLYWTVVISSDAGGSTASVPVEILVTAGTESIIEKIMTAVKATIDGAGLTDSGGDAVLGEIELPPLFDSVNTSIIKIFPDNDELEPDHSTINSARYRINIVLCERAKTTAKQNADLLIRQQMQDLFVGQRLSGLPLLYCTEAVSSIAFDYESLKEKFNFISPVTIEFQANRAKI